MLQLLKTIKHNLPLLWRSIESVNGAIVGLLYGKAVAASTQAALASSDACGCTFRLIEKGDLQPLAEMLRLQPEGFDRYFKPHGFDPESLARLLRNRSFLMLGAFEEDRIVGYFFLRLFANRKAFRGKLVDSARQGRGIAKQMGRIMSDIAFGAGFRLFATISESNLSSIASSRAVNDVRIVKRLPDGYLYVEYTKTNL